MEVRKVLNNIFPNRPLTDPKIKEQKDRLAKIDIKIVLNACNKLFLLFKRNDFHIFYFSTRKIYKK